MSILRKAALEPSTYIWIDALCIDQSNGDEKAVQVRLMRDVYGAAKKVVAWLGNATPTSEEAINFLYTLAGTPFFDTSRPVPLAFGYRQHFYILLNV
jgi:Heterokaryon incompatibility protein (HET)